MPVSIIILADPSTGSDEALGRVFNALAAAYDFKTNGEEVSILFQGAGTRWAPVLGDPEHPAHELYESVRDTVAGASHACATVFGATDDVVASGLELIRNNPIPGTDGLPSLREIVARGDRVLIF